MRFLYELLPKDERGGAATWALLMVCVSNETPATYSLNIVAFKQAWHLSLLAGAFPGHLQIEKGAVESCFAIDFFGILTLSFQFLSLGCGSGRARHCREDWLKGERRAHSGRGVAQFLYSLWHVSLTINRESLFLWICHNRLLQLVCSVLC